MWNTSVKIEYIAGLIVDALENYSVNRENAQFRLVIEELRNHFTNCSEQEITDIISLCMKMYSSKKIEHAESMWNSLRSRSDSLSPWSATAREGKISSIVRVL